MPNKNKVPRFVSLFLIVAIIIISLVIINAQNLLQIISPTNQIIELSKKEFQISETIEIKINLDDFENINIDLYTPNAIYKYPYPSNNIKYRPNSEGTYRLVIFKNKELIASETFYVLNQPENKEIDSLSQINETNPLLTKPDLFIEKEIYSLGEDVLIYINSSDLSNFNLLINTSYGIFNYMDLKTNLVKFIPRKEGEYSIILHSQNSETKKIFFVEKKEYKENELDSYENKSTETKKGVFENKTIDEPNDNFKIIDTNIENNFIPELLPEIKDKANFKIKNSKGYYLIANITLSNEKLRNLTLDSFSVVNLPSGNYDIEIEPTIKNIKKIKLKNVSFNGNFDLGLEEIETQKTSFKDIQKAIAIDPSQINFTEGIIEINATSDVLLKCKNWNFTEQKCYGNFELIKNLEKGKTYLIEINSTDPAYYELGLASINTNKSLYKENKIAQIWITALDYTGHLITNANISLKIISPNNEIFGYYTDSNISQIESGIYELNFTTKEQGNYTIFANVYSNLINTTLFSYFSVLDYYDFDIIRKSPLTTDPWRDSFTTKLKVISNITSSNSSLFNLTEKIPISFEIIETDALITNDSNYYYLTWYNLENNTEVNYTALAPFITPALYELQSYITYGINNENETITKIFNEAKPWFLAVDPIMYAQSCQAQDNTNGQNTFSSSCQGTYPGSCGLTGDRVTCNDGIYEQHNSSTNARWSGVRISAYDSTITDCVSITRVELCYEWWREAGYSSARIAVDRNNWASPTTVTTTLPGTTANPGVTCADVTASEAWTCDNFNGQGTAAQAVAQVQRDNSGGGARNLYVDVLFFNVTYLRDYPPNITQNTPSSYYYNDTASPINIVFNCSAVDDIRVQNISLYITNLNNNSFAFNQSCNILSTSGSCQWTLLLSSGNYTWNCLAYDNRTQGTWGTNRTIVINYTEPPKPLIHSYQCEINTLNNWQPCNTISYGNTILRVRANTTTQGTISNVTFLLYNLPDDVYLLNSTITTETSGYYIYDNDDLQITDSGYFNLSVISFNSYKKNQTNTTAWNLPFGTLISQLIYPTDSISVPQNSTFNFTSRLTCSGGECGDVNATLDPIFYVTFEHSFDVNAQNFTWLDDIYGTNQPTQEDGYWRTSTYCIGGCLFADLNTPNASHTGPWSGGFNKTFNLTPYTYGLNANITINITFDYNLIIDQTTETGEIVYLYYRNITSKSAVQGSYIEGSGSGGTDEVFENSSGRVSLLFYNVTPLFSFDVGCYLTDTSSNGEDGGCFIDNILVQATINIDKGKISTTPGTKPFWTSSFNPYTESNLACLRNMISSQTCDTSWIVNATGPLETTWEFFVLYEPTEYSSYVSLNKSKSVNITITDAIRPTITSLQCQRNSTTWLSCDLIKYNEYISGVRGTCSYTQGPLTSMTFNLKNLFYNRTYFDVSTTDNSTGYWTSTFSPIKINNSGGFELYSRCYANSIFAEYQLNWTLPYGTIQISWLNLSNEVNVTQNKFSNFSVTLTCQGGECINISAFIDPEVGQQFALITLDGSTNFPLRDGLCTAGTDTCAVSSPWDDFDNCIAGNGQYGICASRYAGSDGTDRGLLCLGCDRNNAGNTGGLYISLNSTPCGGYPCQSIFISYYQAVQSMDAANEGSVVLVRDSDGTWREVSRCIDNDLCDCDRIAGCSISTIGQYAQYVNVNLCDILGIDCTQPLDIFFTSYSTAVNQGTGDYFMWDQINVTGYLPKGIIPYETGAPFYTTYANPVYRQNNSCLAYLESGQSCTITWPVNATGRVNSMHEFYVNATPYNSDTTQSSIINVRIVENQIPYVSYVSLTPTQPTSYDDLNCSFIINDANYFDTLYANVTWYRNDLVYSSSLISVYNNQLTSAILSSSNTNNGEIWHCGITPYDETIYGNQVNSSQATILISNPPIISNVQCQRNSTSWVSCSDIKFNDILTMVRAQCIDTDGSVMNVTFNLTNFEDNYLFFKNTTYTLESGYYYFNNTDILIRDSGNFNLSVSCIDDTNVETIYYLTWLVPFGTLKGQWLNPPNIDVNVTRYKLSNFSVRITCVGGECGNITAVLDPLMLYPQANMDFESPTNFPLATGQCGTGAGWQCADSSPWDDFDDCIAGSGVYGICASTEANAGENSLRGLEARGFDRADTSNLGGLYINIPSRSCNDYICEQINISFNQIVQSMDSADEGSAVFVSDEDGIWRNVTTCMDNQPNCDCDVILGCTRAEMGSYMQFFKTDLCKIPGINCSQNLSIKFTSYNAVDHATGDYFAWDNILVEKYGQKGIVPVGSGFPFYVIENNPRTYIDFSCLRNMTSGNSCDITWQLNSTGNYNKTHEFFAYFNSTYSEIIINETKHINVTIRENLPPRVVSISIGPDVALNDTDIYCNFTITDPNYFDNLWVNVTWYRNNTFYFNQQVPALINTLTSVTLLANNTEPGEYWHCGITPYDDFLYGSQMNSTNITIYLYPPPNINSIQCNVNGIWQSCTNVIYYKNFSAIRTNCSSNEGMVNATFNFTNIPDNKVFFNNLTTTYSNGYFIFDFEDINITDSGEMEIYAKCIDNVNQVVYGKVNWTIPWGTLTASLVYPDSDTSVQRNNFFTFQARVTCSGGECGNINATLDPYVNSTIYDYSTGYNIDKFAWVIDSNNNPPESLPNSRTALTLAQVALINISDNNRYTLPDPGAGDWISLEMIMNIKEKRTDITKLQFFFEGYPSVDSTLQIYAWNFNTNSWNSIATQSFSTGTDQIMTANITSNILNYINASNNNIRWLLLNTVTSEYILVDYVSVNVTYNAYKGIIPRQEGAIPFYTRDYNPKDYTNQSCLANMIAGQSCIASWLVNATGPLGSTHEFFVYFNATNYSQFIQPKETSHIFITITDASLVPPVVILNAPQDNLYTSDQDIIFNCSVTDNSNLKNISLVANFNGIFEINETYQISGTSNTSLFYKYLEDGRYTWNCLAYDSDNNFDWGNANRTLTIDTFEPTIIINYPKDYQTYTTSDIDLNFTAIDAFDSILLCNIYLNGELYYPNINAQNNTPYKIIAYNLTPQDYEWQVTCIDDANNYNVSEIGYFTLSDIPPTVTLLTQDNFYFRSPNISLNYYATDNWNINVSTLILNGNPYDYQYNLGTSIYTNFNLTNMLEGFYNWTVNVSDASNLSDQAPIRYFTIDYTAPNIVIFAPDDNLTISSSQITINFTATDNLDFIILCNLTINNQLTQTNIPAINNSFVSYPVTNFIDGLNYWNLTCFDDAGNYNTSETRMLNVSAPPTVVLNYPESNHFQNQQNITLYYTPDDNVNLSVCELFINNQYNQSNNEIIKGIQNTFELFSLSENFYTWSVRCNDTSNISTMSETRNFTIDLTKPTIYLLYPNNGDTVYGRTTNFNFSVIDNYDINLTCNITVDGNVKASNLPVLNNTPTNFSINVSEEGPHSYYVSCIDDATNYNISETRNYFTTNPPEVQLVFPNNGAILNYNLINFTYIVIDDNLANATLILNGRRNETNNTLINEQENYFRIYLNDGIYNWTVNVTDQTYLYTMPNVLTFTIDTTPPVITINHPVGFETLDWNNVTLNFSVKDNLFEPIYCNISINSVPQFVNISVNNNSNVIRYFALNDGTHSWQVRCIDLANNTATTTENFIVEAPPRVNLINPVNQTRTTQQSFNFQYLPYDVFGLYNCTLVLDNNLNESSSSINNNQINTLSVSYIPEGLHNWTVRCIDNPPDYNSYQPDPWQFRIDLTGPTIILRYPMQDQTFNLNNITFNYTAIDSDNIIIDCNISVSDPYGNRLNATSMPAGYDHIITITNLSDGDHYWNVTCVDDLGNVNTSETKRFIINQPDLFTNDSRVFLNNTNPDLYENITISINVSNIGGQPANNVLVNFYDGNPNLGGIFIGNDTKSVAINQTITFTTSWLITPGYHTIYISVDPYNQISELDETNNNATTNISVLWANITYPNNQSWFNTLTIPINFTAYDYTGNQITYNVLIDNNPNGQSGSVIDGDNNQINVVFTQGIRTLKIRVNDSYYYLGNTIQRIKDSIPITLYIDVTPPTITFNTLNLTWFNSEPILNFTITDNLDNLVNYTIYINNNPFISGAANSSSQNITLSNLQNGTYQIYIEAFDEALNYRNSSVLTIYLDTVKPTIYLLGPQNGISLLNNYTTFNFSVIDNLDTLLECNLTIDNQVNVSNIYAYNNSFNSTHVYNLREGTHYWNVSCWDGNLVTPVSLINTSETYYFNIFNPPIITLIQPENNNWTNNSEVIFFFNVSEETGLQNCSILLNGQNQNTKQGNLLNKNGLNNITLTNLNGTYSWQIECYDNTTIYNYAISESRTLNVDLDAPIPYIETLNNTWFNYNNPLIYFNISDNMASIINYTFYVNSTQNRQGSVNNATPSSTNLNPIADGYYLLTLEAFDYAYNKRNSTPIKIYVDTTKPTITLINPENGNSTTNTNILFNFSAYDNLANYLICNLTVDNQIMQTFNTTSGSFNYTYINMQAGTHYWNVTCSDSVGNFNTSETRYFVIPLPDLYVSADYIFFNTTAPEENSNITINVSIFNIGDTNAYNVIIQFFDGHYLNGTQINGNFTYNISAGQNVTINLSWKVSSVGDHNIYVIADPPLQTNGTIKESNETNNYAYKLIIVGSYTYVYGNFTAFLNLKDINNITLYQWDINDFNGSKIFAVDYDSNIDWRKLQSISRDINNNYVSNDFYEIDLALRMENNSDSINRTWILNNIPYYTKNYDIFLTNIQNIPFINSTNNTNFQTGILWDYSDGNTQYNGTQDLVFFTIVNINQTGIHGKYDYELKVPANLRYYKQPNIATIALYTELK